MSEMRLTAAYFLLLGAASHLVHCRPVISEAIAEASAKAVPLVVKSVPAFVYLLPSLLDLYGHRDWSKKITPGLHYGITPITGGVKGFLDESLVFHKYNMTGLFNANEELTVDITNGGNINSHFGIELNL
uniref:Uncharacterized protein n=1 Tax=Clastoptera arizonana TaxID=38151 RepID=A0A1B6C0T4_9HEMI